MPGDAQQPRTSGTFQALMQEFRDCISTGEVRTMEYRRLTKTGGWKWIRSVGKIVEFDVRGKPLRMAGTHTDITERKELETRLLHSQRLESVGTLGIQVLPTTGGKLLVAGWSNGNPPEQRRCAWSALHKAAIRPRRKRPSERLSRSVRP